LTDVTVSVCIRGSRSATLPDALTSVLAQGRTDIEVIVGDEHGTLADVVARFGDPRVRYRPFERPPGPSAQARTLFGEARGRYLVLMDDDDWWLPGFLDSTIAQLEADPSIGVVFTNYLYGAGGRLCARRWPLADGRHDAFLRTILRGTLIAVSFSLIRREIWEKGEERHPLRDEATVDYTLWLRTAAAGWPFYFLGEPLGVYRMHPGQMTQDAAVVGERMIGMWESFDFEDPEAERLRRLRLAEALLERAHRRLRRGQVRAALGDIKVARENMPNWLGERGLVALFGLRRVAARFLVRHPRVVQPAFTAWGVLGRFDRFG
jgi:hypothetical protein